MARWTFACLAVLGLALLGALPAAGEVEGWHRTMDDGLEAAKKSGKPLLVVTLWSPKT